MRACVCTSRGRGHVGVLGELGMEEFHAQKNLSCNRVSV